MSFTCLVVTVLVIVLFPIHLLMWATESKSTRINRLRSQGQTWKAIGTKYGVSASTARRWATA